MITALPRIAIATPDFDGLLATCRHALGLPVVDLTAQYLGPLGARLAMCVPPGGSHIELMSPAVADAPLSQSLQRFLDRRGPGLFALMLEAPDPDAEAQALAGRGLQVLPRMAGAGGRDLHPASTHGVLVRVYPMDSFQGEPPPGSPPSPLSGVQRVQVAVRDLDRACATWGHGLGLAVDSPGHDDALGLARARVRAPRGATVELLAVRDAARPGGAALAAHLAARGEGLYALALQVRDDAALRERLQAAGLATTVPADAPDTLELPAAALAGARLRLQAAPH